MNRLIEGIRQFRKLAFPAHRELYTNLAGGQHPHTLFIACSDSRVDPNLITNKLPGELFVIRNIANMVPPYKAAADHTGTSAAIEFAVKVLKVRNIVVCGHSSCGGCAALLRNESAYGEFPFTKKWLELADGTKEKMKRENNRPESPKKDWLLEHFNIADQVDNLHSYPFIREKSESGEIRVFGWYYVIGTGEVYNYNRDTETFLLLN